jgi:photosystem II stability/assembly factor-like uncharacterized protein
MKIIRRKFLFTLLILACIVQGCNYLSNKFISTDIHFTPAKQLVTPLLTETRTRYPTRTKYQSPTITPTYSKSPSEYLLQNNWIATGLADYEITTIAIDPMKPTVLYSGTIVNGMYKSTDSGKTWRLLDTGFTNLSIESIVIDPSNPSNVYSAFRIGVDYYLGVYKSINGGGSWFAINSGLEKHQITDLVIDPFHPSILYAADWRSGVYKSTNGGISWRPINNGFPINNEYLAIWSITMDPKAPNTLYVGTKLHGLYKSITGGEDWERIYDEGRAIGLLVVDPTKTTTLFGIMDYSDTYGSTLYKSIDGGITWAEVKYISVYFIHVNSVTIDPINSNNLYVGAYDGVFKSINGGEYWDKIGLSYITVRTFAFGSSKSSILYAGTRTGVFSLNIHSK